MSCKFIDGESGGTISDLIDCIDYAINHGAKIFNCSFGSYVYSSAVFDAFNRARSAGVIVVCAAGNDGIKNGMIFEDQKYATYPASYSLDNIVSVAATGYLDVLAYFSNYGKESVHLAAPGVAIFSTYGGPPDNLGFSIMGYGDSYYAYIDGTSAAAPFVSGAFALLMAQFPNEPYNSLIARLLAATDKVPSLQDTTISGGRLNIANALTAPFTPLPLPPLPPLPPPKPTPWYEYDPNRTRDGWWNSL
jgi:subtilisin family serine protease